VFITSSFLLMGQGQLRFLGFVIAGSFILFFLKERRELPAEIIIYFIWIGWSLSGFATSTEKDAFARAVFGIFQIGIMNFVVSGITARRGSMGLNLFALLTGGVMIFIFSLVTGQIREGLNPEMEVRAKGFVHNPNHYSDIMIFGIMSLAYFWGQRSSKRSRAVIGVIIAIFALGIIVSGSRRAFLGLMVFFILWLLVCYRKLVMRKVSFFFALLLIFTGLFFFTDFMLTKTYMGQRFREDFIEDPITKRHEGYKRIDFYKEGWAMFKSSPIFGVGLGNFEVLSKHRTYSHSDYVEVAACTGSIGFALYFLVFFFLWRRLNWVGRRLRNPSVTYNLGLMKVSLITILLMASGRPTVYYQLPWIFISSLIGYAYFLEKTIREFREFVRYNPQAEQELMLRRGSFSHLAQRKTDT